jgi:hypothetical protein
MKQENDAFTTVFTVSIAPEEAWPKIARKVGDKAESAADAAPGTQVWLPGWEMTGEVLEAEPGKKLLLRKDGQPCKGTEILIELQAAGAGTRVRLVQSGFAAAAPTIALNMLGIGADFIFRDFALYLETGVIAGRHMSSWATSFGAEVEETPTGLRIGAVPPNTFAARAGLEAGDRLVTLAGAAVITQRDLVIALRTQMGQERVPLNWARGGEKMSGYGAFK